MELYATLEGDCTLVKKVQIIISNHPSLGAGHYTAFARQDDSSQWNYFNDAHVSFSFHSASSYRPHTFQVDPRLPEGEGQDDVYVLFYKRAGFGLSPSCQEVPTISGQSAMKICQQQGQATGQQELLPGPAFPSLNYSIE